MSLLASSVTHILRGIIFFEDERQRRGEGERKTGGEEGKKIDMYFISLLLLILNISLIIT